MKRRIDELLQGKFEYAQEKMVISAKTLSASAAPGETARGSFTVSHPSGKKMRVFVYCGHPRVSVSPEDFQGSSGTVVWEADTKGLSAGERIDTAIAVCSDLEEQILPLEIGISGERVTPEELDLNAFTELAKSDPAQARAVFLSDSFAAGIARTGVFGRTLYETLLPPEGKRDQEAVSSAIEEFLIGSGQKESVGLSLETQELTIERPENSERQIIRLERSGWGYLAIEVTSDSLFLRPEESHLTTERFAGNSYELGFIVDVNFLHAGRNFGRIVIRTIYQTLCFEVSCCSPSSAADRRSSRARRQSLSKMIQLILNCRSGQLDKGAFAERTENALASFRRNGGEGTEADLFECYLLLEQGRRVRAEKVLSEIKARPERLKKPEDYVFAAILSTYFTRDGQYQNDVAERVRSIARENHGSWKISYLRLIFMAEDFRTDSQRLGEVVNCLKAGCSSPLMLMEGTLVLKDDPFLIHEITPEIRLLFYFAARENLVSEQLLLQITGLVLRGCQWHPVLFRALNICWRQTRLKEALAALCALAISGKKSSPEYFPLYESALQKDVRVSGLYEYYIETMDPSGVGSLPPAIQRYLILRDPLSYGKTAQIFAAVLDRKDTLPGLYKSLVPAMQKFTLDQLAAGHITPALAKLYGQFLPGENLTGQLSHSLSKILFTFELTCKNPDIVSVVTADCRLSKRTETPVRDQRAMIVLLSESSRIFLKSSGGNLYTATDLYMAEHLLEDPDLIRLAYRNVPDDPTLTVFQVLNAPKTQSVDSASLAAFRSAADMAEFTEESRSAIRAALLDYYRRNPDDDSLRSFLMEADKQTYAKTDKRTFLSLLTGEGFSEDAYRLLLKYGTENVLPNVLVRIASQVILEHEYEKDSQLLKLAGVCFFDGKYDQHILTYLMMYYDGPVSSLQRLWTVCRQYELDTEGLEERILLHAVFSHTQENPTGAVYTSFRASRGSVKLLRAYVIMRCYDYFVKGQPEPEAIFSDLLTAIRKRTKIPDVCALALLQHLSSLPQRTEEEEADAEKILESFSQRGMRFAFYLNFPAKLQMRCGLMDKTFFECVADPQSQVTLLWRRKGDGTFQEEPMRDVFEGIRVKEFILFPGEEYECCTVETKKDGSAVRSGIRLVTCRPVPEELSKSRFGLLSALSASVSAGDMNEAAAILDSYRQLETLSSEIFTLC